MFSKLKLEDALFASIAIVLLLVGTATAQSCEENPIGCTPAQLCEKSTETINGKRYWIAEADDPYLRFSEKFGLQCGAERPLTECQREPNNCTLLELCESATLMKDGALSWNENSQAHVELAAAFGLSCDVIQENSSREIGQSFQQEFKDEQNEQEATEAQLQETIDLCISNPFDKSCTEAALCTLATTEVSGSRKWNAGKFKAAAQGKSFSCGVE